MSTIRHRRSARRTFLHSVQATVAVVALVMLIGACAGEGAGSSGGDLAKVEVQLSGVVSGS